MSDVVDIKQRLLNAQWHEYKRVSVEAEGGAVELVIRRPPDSVLTELLAGAREQGLNAAGGDEKDPVAALHFRARVVAATTFLPNAVRPLFTHEEVLGWPGVWAVADACMEALAPAKALESAKGN